MTETTGTTELTTRSDEGVDHREESAADRARRAGEEARARMKGSVRERTHDAKRRASREADRWTSSLGQQVECVARALRAAGDSLAQDEERRISDWSRAAADEVERMAGYLRDEDPGAMIGDLEAMAQRNPTAFVGTTFALGLLAGRFLRSSEPTGQALASSGNGGPPVRAEQPDAPTAVVTPQGTPMRTPAIHPIGEPEVWTAPGATGVEDRRIREEDDR